jgi:hypothetical protein
MDIVMKQAYLDERGTESKEGGREIRNLFHLSTILFPNYTEQFKKKVTLSHIYSEVTSEPTITRYTTTVKKTLEVCL